MALAAKDLAIIPNKEVAVVANKEVAVVPNKEVAVVANKEVSILPNKEVANLAKKTVSLPISYVPRSSYSCNMTRLPKSVQMYIEEKAKVCQPDNIHICDGSEEEYQLLLKTLQESGWIQKLENGCWLALTDPNDVARVESRTFIR